MENIQLECPFCRQHLDVDASCAGTNCKCPVCGGKFVVPSSPDAGQECVADDGIARRKLSGAFKGYIWFTVTAIIGSVLLFLGFGGLFFLEHPYSEGDRTGGGAGVGIFLIVLLIFFLAVCVLGLLAFIYKCILLYRLWSLVPPEEAATTPGKAVGFQFIPFFNLYWNFIAYGKLGKYLQLVTGSAAPHTWALIYSWLPIAGLALNLVRVFGVFVSLFMPRGGAVINVGASFVGFLLSIFGPIADIVMMVSLTKAARRWRNWD